MKTIAVLGAGNIGRTIAQLLEPNYSVIIVDTNLANLRKLNPSPHISQILEDALKFLTTTKFPLFCVINCLPHNLVYPLAEETIKRGTNYIDLTEDVDTVKNIKDLSTKVAFRSKVIPCCGLAPGFVGIVANTLAKSFVKCEAIMLRAGALPLAVSNPYFYNLTWSPEGLINEYDKWCPVRAGGNATTVAPLSYHDNIYLGGLLFESFTTSGGLGNLLDVLPCDMMYKSIRYPGHLKAISNTIVATRNKQLRELPATEQDMVVVHVSAYGETKNNPLMERNFTAIYRHDANNTAIELTTANSVCAILDLLAEDKISIAKVGYFNVEEIPLKEFLRNRYGRYFEDKRERAGI